MLHGKKILLGVTGSIAAYKTATLARLLIREGAEVQVVMTKSATDFITPLTLSTLTRRPVLIEPFHPVSGEWYSHVDWANWADLYLIAPLTANTLAKMAAGQADNLLIAIYLAARCPVYFCPVMDVDMYGHPATQKNIETLCSYNNHFIPPAEGELASGLSGKGRLPEPEILVTFLKESLKKKRLFNGTKILLTAGPTHEQIDPVRFIGNNSSGKMGFALAEAFAGLGAEVTLITGPVGLHVKHESIRRVDVTSAREMLAACLDFFPSCDILCMAAAVADFRPAEVAENKIKKTAIPTTLDLVPNPDILYSLAQKKHSRQLLIGFALETQDEDQHALQKLKNKNLDMVVLNSLQDLGAGFGHDTNKVKVFMKSGVSIDLPLMSKQALANSLAELVYEYSINNQ